MRAKISIWVLCLFLAGCSTVKKHPHFDKRAKEVQTVSVMAPDVQITRIVFKGDNEILFDDGKAASGTILKALETELARRGYDVKPVSTTAGETIAADHEAAFELSKLKERYAALLNDLQKKKGKDFRLTLGSDINRFADMTGADILVFATGSGYVKSGGEIAKGIAKSALIAAASLGTVIYIEQDFGGQLFVSVVDGDNGDILWHNFANPALAYNMTKEKVVRSMAQQVIASYPGRMRFEEVAVIQAAPAVSAEEADIGRAKINLPLETVKMTAKTGAVVTEKTLDLTEAVLKGTLFLGKTVPRTTKSLVQLGATRSSEGDRAHAIEAYEEALKLDRQNPAVHLLLADLYLQEGNLNKAEKYAKKSIQLDGANPAAHGILSRIFLKKGLHAEAEKEMNLFQAPAPVQPTV